MKNNMKNNKIETMKIVVDTGVYGIGILGSVAVINRCWKQAVPQIKEAEGWRKLWYIVITTLTIGFYGGTIFLNALMSIENIFSLAHKSEPDNIEPLREEVFDGEEDISLSGMEHYWNEREKESEFKFKDISEMSLDEMAHEMDWIAKNMSNHNNKYLIDRFYKLYDKFHENDDEDGDE